MRLHLFNPENDLALGAGCANYTPPPRVAALSRAGSLMPMWWADDGDMILVSEPMDDDAGWLRHEYGLCGVPGCSGKPAPWGWSAYARRRFRQAGVRDELLLADGDIERMRFLSHRRTSVVVLDALGMKDLAGEEVTDAGRVAELVGEGCALFLKSPWSCSGRGVFGSRGIQPEVICSKAEGIIHRQGSVMVEREYDKIVDFAALFRSHDGVVEFAGWSVFEAARYGAYAGNIVAPQSELLDRIASRDAVRIIPAVEEALTRVVAPHYTGPLGVDMMIYDDGGQRRLHPCIELNLRMTMGFVAMEVQRRLSPSRPGLLGWDYTGGRPSAGLVLLPPRDGFALTLKAL